MTIAKEVQTAAQPRPAPRRPDRPGARPPPDNHRAQRFNPAEARRLQSLYRHSRKRAARKVLANESPIYNGTLDEAKTFFTNVFNHKHCNTETLAKELQEHVPSLPIDESLFDPPTAAEVSAKLRMMSNSAPGKDRVEYRHLRVIDPKGELLASIFGHCIRQRDVPDIWKTATTILIHKKGPTDDVSNFRPIALMSCIYKLLMGLLARRMSKWAIENALLSEEQKSARPTEGCYEHGFLLQSVIGDTRRTQKNVFVAWLDLRNAFGSVPHDAIFTTLTHMGFPPDLVNMIRNAYTNATTEIRTNTGITNAIPIHAGVKQGCPMSPVLFNLALELVLRKIKAASESCWRGPARHHTVPISVIAYADDLVLLARQKQSLQHLLDAASSAATTIGLEFRPDKSASLSLVKSKRAEHQDEPVQRNIFTIQNNQIPSLGAEDHYRYFCPTLPDLRPLRRSSQETVPHRLPSHLTPSDPEDM